MQRLFVWVTSLMIVAFGVVAAAQTKVTTLEEHAAVMKANAQAAGPMNKAIASGAYADAKTQLATLRQNYTALQGFWANRKADPAVAILKDGLSKLDALDKMISAPTVDQMAAQAAGKEFQGTCGACHKQYREGDAQTGYKIKE
jgi:cytochrome c556